MNVSFDNTCHIGLFCMISVIFVLIVILINTIVIYVILLSTCYPHFYGRVILSLFYKKIRNIW